MCGHNSECYIALDYQIPLRIVSHYIIRHLSIHGPDSIKQFLLGIFLMLHAWPITVALPSHKGRSHNRRLSIVKFRFWYAHSLAASNVARGWPSHGET